MTTEPMVWFPISARQRELAKVGVSDPAFLEPTEIHELTAINMLQWHRDVVAACVSEPDPDDLWPVRDWSDEEDD